MQMVPIVIDIRSIKQTDPSARAHTRTHNAVATDADRIGAARWAAQRLQQTISRRSEARRVGIGDLTAGCWEHYADSVGGINSICPDRVPS